jgi:hypothetical protein
MNRKVLALTALLLGLFAPVSNAAYTYDFQIFNNADYENNPDFAFTVEVSDIGGQALFEFRNNSTKNSVITEIYFDSEGLLALDHITNYIVDETDRIGTKFENDRVNPGNLPGAHLLDPYLYFEANPDLSVQACAPSPKWGIGPGEELQIVYNLIGGSDIINEMYLGTNLRIGLHIQSVDTQGVSLSAINNVPEPVTICLLGLGGLTLLKKRRAEKA